MVERASVSLNLQIVMFNMLGGNWTEGGGNQLRSLLFNVTNAEASIISKAEVKTTIRKVRAS